MKLLLVIMTGIGFTLGVVLGLLLHLPSDSLPAQRNHATSLQDARHRRQADSDSLNGNYQIRGYKPSSARIHGEDDEAVAASLHISDWNAQQDVQTPGRNSHSNELPVKAKVNSEQKGQARKGGQRSLSLAKQTGRVKLDRSLSGDTGVERNGDSSNPVFSRGLDSKRKTGKNDLKHAGLDAAVNSPSLSGRVRTEGLQTSNSNEKSRSDGLEKETAISPSLEDQLYLSSVVRGVYWTDKMETACRKPFTATDTDSWRTKVQGLDVVKMEAGCGRMQNRLLTFRDASKACARYRLNTDQIQGDIFSYYLAKLLKIPNLPPTILASVNSVDQKWRTVHLDLSLAQWADSKLVVLTKYIEDLRPAHIPKEFRDNHRQLLPTLAHLGSKSQTELCELMQWSDLIVFDYLTANLDRVINNMFNSQWNDQMMSSPTHNLEQFSDGGLVFLDNESGLFHGFRLIEKYEKLHRALLDSVCVFRSSTADVIKRLATSGSVGKELRALLESNEALASHVPSMPAKNVKILERRIQQVYKQIVRCENELNS